MEQLKQKQTIQSKQMNLKQLLTISTLCAAAALMAGSASVFAAGIGTATGPAAGVDAPANVQNASSFDESEGAENRNALNQKMPSHSAGQKAETSKGTSKDKTIKADANKTDDSKTEASKAENINAANQTAGALAQLKELLGPISSIQGNFNQKILNERGKLLMQGQGMMWLKRPGKFRWEVQGKDKHLVISNGKEVWDFDPQLSQVTVQNLPKTKGSTPIYFLTGDVNSLEKDFAVEVIANDAGKCLNGSDTCFELKPKAASSSFHWIRVGFSGTVLKEIEMLDQLGQRSLFSFHKISMNQAIPHKQFQFVPPQGVDVVRN